MKVDILFLVSIDFCYIKNHYRFKIALISALLASKLFIYSKIHNIKYAKINNISTFLLTNPQNSIYLYRYK